MSFRALALDAAEAGDAKRAARWLERAGQVARQRQSAHEAACNGLCAARLALRQGLPAEAARHAAAAGQAFDQLQMGWHHQQALQLLPDGLGV
jgi:hypothetical protein